MMPKGTEYWGSLGIYSSCSYASGNRALKQDKGAELE